MKLFDTDGDGRMSRKEFDAMPALFSKKSAK